MTPLRQRLIEDMQLRNMAAETIKGYVRYVAQFAKHFGRSPEAKTCCPSRIEASLVVSLAVAENVPVSGWVSVTSPTA